MTGAGLAEVLAGIASLHARLDQLEVEVREAPRRERIDVDNLIRHLVESARQAVDAEAELKAELEAMPPGRRLKVVSSN